MRVFSATLATETNTFSPLPTSLDAYREGVFLRPGEHPDDAPRMCTGPLFLARRRAKTDGFTLIEGSCFAASPTGTTNRAAYEFMRDEILNQLKQAMPVDAVVEVKCLKRDCWQSFGPSLVPLGDCAAVRVGGVDAVLVTARNQAMGLELFSNVGIDPRALKLIVVKSTNHFMAAFGPIAKKMIFVDTSGPLNRNYRSIPYQRVTRPIWPLDESTTPGLIY